MVSDYHILGINETDDLPTIKAAYRRRVKELHPDLSSPEDALKNHYLFISICQAYERIVSGLRATREIKIEGTAIKGAKANISVYSDQAYAFYKQGMKAFMAIHPSAWNIDNGSMLNTQIAGDDTKEQDEIKRRILELVKLFPKAYYYFSIVIHEYPESEWAFDAKDKMDKIEDRVKRYKKIIESFTAWNKDKQEEVERYNETYNKFLDNEKAVRRDMPKNWES
jgi:DnaJ-class molecular chaperone with C-terminal Zn finger domain